MIDHVWRERRTIADRMIALRPTSAFALEGVRRILLDGARALRDRLR
jgi:hypothetical protein